MKKILLSAAMLLVCSTTAAFALEAKVSTNTSTSAAKDWAVVGDFCGIASWHPAVTKCVSSTKDGHQVRFLSLKGGGTIEEELVSRDDKKMKYTYKILKSPLPVEHYKSTIRVKPKGTGATIEWSGHFTAKKGSTDADAVKVITGIYKAGVDGIAAQAAK
jgi:Polyketide cyclase / dehydrase and lipid transport